MNTSVKLLRGKIVIYSRYYSQKLVETQVRFHAKWAFVSILPLKKKG